MGKNENNNSIPFVKPARVGNFKIWRSKVALAYMPELDEDRKNLVEEHKAKVKKQKVDIEAIHISNLEGSWSVKIPQTFEMFGMLTVAYQWSLSDNVDEKKRGEDFLRTALSNIMYVSAICNGFYHHGVQMVTTAYANPDIFREKKKRKAFKKQAEELVEHFLTWRDEYEKQIKENEPTEKELQQDAIAEDAMGILNEKEPDD